MFLLAFRTDGARRQVIVDDGVGSARSARTAGVPAGTDDLSVERLTEKAARIAGVDDGGGAPSTAAVELLVGSCERTATLNPLGRKVLASAVVRHLVNRLLVHAEMVARPDVAARPVGAAVVVTGLPRTGTTMLHNLLALDPSHRVVRLWQALHPVPPDTARGESEAALVRQAATWLERLYAAVPCFRSIHGATPDGPEECDALLQNEFASQHFDDMFDAQDYSAWLATASLRREYESYARQLALLAGPDGGATSWALKSPSHLGHLEDLLAVSPHATIVHCHRHPAEAVPSYASLMLCLRRAYSDEVSPATVGRQASARSVVVLDRALDVRERSPDNFVDIAYAQLVRHPVATVAELYEQLGRPFPAPVSTAMARWVTEHPQHQHGVHRYSAEDFGLSAGVVAGQFERYLEQFADAVR